MKRITVFINDTSRGMRDPLVVSVAGADADEMVNQAVLAYAEADPEWDGMTATAVEMWAAAGAEIIAVVPGQIDVTWIGECGDDAAAVEARANIAVLLEGYMDKTPCVRCGIVPTRPDGVHYCNRTAPIRVEVDGHQVRVRDLNEAQPFGSVNMQDEPEDAQGQIWDVANTAYNRGLMAGRDEWKQEYIASEAAKRVHTLGIKTGEERVKREFRSLLGLPQPRTRKARN